MKTRRTPNRDIKRTKETASLADALVLDVEMLEPRIAPARLGVVPQGQPFTPHSIGGDSHLEDCCN